MERFIILKIGQAGPNYVYQIAELGPDGTYEAANRGLPKDNSPQYLEEARKRLEYARTHFGYDYDL